MNGFWRAAAAVLTLAALSALVAAGMVSWYRRSDDRPGLIVRWIITAAILAFLAFVVGPIVGRFDMVAAFAGVPMALAAGVVMAITWTPNMTAWVGRKFGQLYDGGDVQPDPEPCFSIAEAQRKAGHYDDAIAEVSRQLELFPDHFGGWMLLAEIQAEDRGDIDAASTTIEQLINQPGHAQKNVAYALTRLADWELKYKRDVDQARAVLERIVERYPDSPEAHFAHQRIAHLSSSSIARANTPPPPIPVPHSDERLGLRPDFAGFKPPLPDYAAMAAELTAQLEKFPFDNQAREDLAVLYAEAYHRLDMASDQFEQLIAQPHAPEKQVVRWLNLLADLQVREGGDPAAPRQTVQRIVDLFPNSPSAEIARRRLATMNLEWRARLDKPAIPFGATQAKAEPTAEV